MHWIHFVCQRTGSVHVHIYTVQREVRVTITYCGDCFAVTSHTHCCATKNIKHTIALNFYNMKVVVSSGKTGIFLGMKRITGPSPCVCIPLSPTSCSPAIFSEFVSRHWGHTFYRKKKKIPANTNFMFGSLWSVNTHIHV